MVIYMFGAVLLGRMLEKLLGLLVQLELLVQRLLLPDQQVAQALLAQQVQLEPHLLLRDQRVLLVLRVLRDQQVLQVQ
jgi:hypothetical protein